MSAAQIVRLMDEEEAVVVRALRAAEEAIAHAAEKVAEVFTKGGRTIYVGAGTSGRIALMDAAEMGPTFSVDDDRFVAVTSGGPKAERTANEGAEDDDHAAVGAMNALNVSRYDAVFGITASGRTPFVLAAVRHARRKGAWTCGIANNPQSPLEELVDHSIVLNTGPEIVTGSTRLKAGTSQKMALNRISTTAMILCGKVVENLMVDVRANNQKLRERTVRIVRDLTHATEEEAISALEGAGWSARIALSSLKKN
jgi:N-acetylmuramic acid 6-phosphate etherase